MASWWRIRGILSFVIAGEKREARLLRQMTRQSIEKMAGFSEKDQCLDLRGQFLAALLRRRRIIRDAVEGGES
jgi:hypothetical protein